MLLLKIPNPYASKNYLFLMGVPVLLLIVSLFFLFGPGLKKGVDFQGGLLITVQTNSNVDTALLESKLSAYSPSVTVSKFSSGSLKGVQIEMALDPVLLQLQTENTIIQALYGNYTLSKSLNPIQVQNYQNQINVEAAKFYAILNKPVPSGNTDALVKSISDEVDAKQSSTRLGIQNTILQVTGSKPSSFDEIGSSLSNYFFTNSQTALIVSLIISGLVILIIVRGLVASIAVISGALFDLVITAGLMVVFNIDLSLGAVAALLMLIGLSLDTDIMLSINVLKRKEGTPQDRAFQSMKIGFLMNFTTLAAFGVLALVGWYYQIPTYSQIGSIVLLGSIVDFIATWCFDAGLILWFAERKQL